MRFTRTLVVAAAFGALVFAGTANAAECTVTIDGKDVRGKTLSGKIKQVKGGKRAKLVVTQYGEHIPFEPHESVVVSGLKDSYDKLKKGDEVTVCGKLLDKPRLALGVEVVPEKDDGAEDL